MSFTAEVKEELAHVEPDCSHCQRALLSALVHVEGTLMKSGSSGYHVQLDTEVAHVARLAITLLHSEYGLETQTVFRRSVLHKSYNYLVDVPPQPGLAEALVDLGILTEEGGLQTGIAPRVVEKQCCAAAYLRGAFLGSGFVASPRTDAHFEITVANEQLAQDLSELMSRKDIGARVMQRRSAYVLYLKSGNAISAFLAYTGAHQCALKLEKFRVYKSLRNDVNRQINAELANQMKATKAAVDQVRAMRLVAEHYGMENLPPALRDVIRLRVQYPDESLAELGARHKPPLSKSAVYHRVRRIEQMAEEIKG